MDCPTSYLEIADPFETFLWNIVVPPRKTISESIAAISTGGYSFPNLRFTQGFMSSTPNTMQVIIYTKQLNVYLGLPWKNSKVSYEVKSSRIDFLKDDQVLNSKIIFFNQTKDASTALEMWAGTVDTSTSWNDEVTSVQLKIKIGRFEVGKCHTPSKWTNVGSKLYLSPDVYSRRPVASDFECLFLNQHLSDIKIECQGEIFPTHKVILAAKSKVFSKMLEQNFKESSERKIVIEDIEPSALREMLRFMYLGKIENPECKIEDLIDVAEKYDLEDMKTLCEPYLLKSLRVENATTIYGIADMYRLGSLRHQVLQFLILNKSKLFKEEADHVSFLHTFPDVMMRLLQG